MTIAQRLAGPVMVLDLSGKLVAGNDSGLLKDKVGSVVFQGHNHVLLNLGGVDYMDSSGLGELISAHTTVSRKGGVVKIVNLTKRVSDLLAIAKVLTVFDVYDTEAEALQSFASAV